MSKPQPENKTIIAEQEAIGGIETPPEKIADEHDLLADGQLRGVDADGQIVTGTHGGPGKAHSKDASSVTAGKPAPIG